MIVINKFTEDELSLIFHVINLNNPKVELTLERLKAYKIGYVAAAFNAVKNKLNDEGVALMKSVFEKIF